MLPLVQQLPFGLGDRSDWSSGRDDAGWVERVATGLGLIGDGAKVVCDACHWVGGRAETVKLRVPRVATSATEKHRLRKKGFAPKCN